MLARLSFETKKSVLDSLHACKSLFEELVSCGSIPCHSGSGRGGRGGVVCCLRRVGVPKLAWTHPGNIQTEEDIRKALTEEKRELLLRALTLLHRGGRKHWQSDLISFIWGGHVK